MTVCNLCNISTILHPAYHWHSSFTFCNQHKTISKTLL